MSGMRQEYFADVLNDCIAVCKKHGIEPEDQAVVIAALIFSDSVNGIRKALLTPNYIVAQHAQRQAPSTSQY